MKKFGSIIGVFVLSWLTLITEVLASMGPGPAPGPGSWFIQWLIDHGWM